MVDFDNQTTVATPAIDVKRILVLQDRQYLKEAIGAYKKSLYGGLVTETHVIRSRLYELFLEVRSGIRRHLKEDEFIELLFLVDSKDVEDIERAFDIIDTWLDDIGLTKIDIKPKLGGNIAARNKAQGWHS